MTKLTDTQTIILSTAAQRDSGSLYPLPESITATGARLTKAIAALVERGLAEERETLIAEQAHRTDSDLRYGIYVTDAGLGAIGIEADVDDEVAPPAAAQSAERVTKASTVLSLLQRDRGATLAELIDATGWLPHTTRAALTGLRKKGHTVVRGKRGGETCYTITVAA